MLALRFNWTPQEINAMDPDFIDELAARLEAEGIQADKQRKRAKK